MPKGPSLGDVRRTTPRRDLGGNSDMKGRYQKSFNPNAIPVPFVRWNIGTFPFALASQGTQSRIGGLPPK